MRDSPGALGGTALVHACHDSSLCIGSLLSFELFSLGCWE